MNGHDLDPHFLVPAWRALVRYFRSNPPLVQASQQLDLPLRRLTDAERKPYRAARRPLYLPADLECRMPHQPSP